MKYYNGFCNGLMKENERFSNKHTNKEKINKSSIHIKFNRITGYQYFDWIRIVLSVEKLKMNLTSF